MLVNSLPKMARSIKAGPCNQPSKAISYAINDGVICNFKNYVKVSSPTVLKGYEIIRSYSGVQCSLFIQSMFINLLQCASPAAGSWTAMKEKKKSACLEPPSMVKAPTNSSSTMETRQEVHTRGNTM